MSKMFNPNAELLQFIGFGEEDDKDGKNGTYVSMELPTRKEDYGDHSFVHAMVLHASFEHWNKIFFGEEKEKEYLRGHWAQIIGGDLLADMLYNANFHGNGNDISKNIYLGVWFGSKGILFGIRDEGHFFRSPKVKETVEGDKDIPSSTGKPGRGTGIDLIQEADKVFVSNEENTLYAAVLLSQLEK